MTDSTDLNTTSVLDVLPDAVIAVDQRGQIAYLNAAAETLTGYESAQLIGEGVEVLIPVSKRDLHTRLRQRYTDAPSAIEMGALRELQLLRHDGSLINVAISLNQITLDGRSMALTILRELPAEGELIKAELLLDELSRVASRAKHIDEVYQVLAVQLKPLIDFDRLAVTLVVPETDLIERVFVSGMEVPGEGVGSRVIHSGISKRSPGPLIGSSMAKTNATSTPAGSRMSASGLQSWAEAALGDPAEPLGFLSLRSTVQNAYGKEDVLLLERIAALISPAIENERLNVAIREETRTHSVLADIGRIISSANNVNEVWPDCAERIVQIIPAKYVVIQSIDHEAYKINSDFAWPERLRPDSPRSKDMKGTVIERAVKERSAFLVDYSGDDQQYLEDYPQSDHSIAQEMKAKVILAPMIYGGEVVGVLSLWCGEELQDHQRHVALAWQVADQISGSIVNAGLRIDLELRNREESALANLASRVTEADGRNEIYRLTDASLQEFIDFDRISITILDAPANMLLQAYQRGTSIEGILDGMELQIVDSIDDFDEWANELTQTAEPEKFLRVGLAPMIHAESGLESRVRAPLKTTSGHLGAIALNAKPVGAFSKDDQRLLARVATQVAPAIEKSLLNEQLQLEIAERIALAEIGRIVNASENIDEIYERFAMILRSIVSAERITVSLITPDGKHHNRHFVWHVDDWRLDTSTDMKIEGTPIEDIIEQKSSMLLSSETKDELVARYAAAGKEIEEGLGSVITVALTRSDEVIGTLHIATRLADAYDWDDVRKLERVAAQISGAIANAQSHAAALEAERERAVAEAKIDELSRVNEERSKFLSTVSHELKTPLTSLTAFTDLLARNRDNNLTERQLRNLTVMQSSARRLNVLIDDLLDVSRGINGTFNLDIQEFDAVDLLGELADSFRPQLDEKEQHLTFKSQLDSAWLKADRTRCAQVVGNLLSNASKYSPTGTEITLECAPNGANINITVADAGIGISEDDQTRLFTPFFRVDNEATRAQPGTGLGLVIARMIVEAHGGELLLSSELGVGTSITMTCPDYRDAPSDEYLQAQKDAELPPVPLSRLA